MEFDCSSTHAPCQQSELLLLPLLLLLLLQVIIARLSLPFTTSELSMLHPHLPTEPAETGSCNSDGSICPQLSRSLAVSCRQTRTAVMPVAAVATYVARSEAGCGAHAWCHGSEQSLCL